MKEETQRPPVGLCLCCGKPVYGRHDKRYCTQKCKTIYNNTMRSSATKAKYRFIDTLDKNYIILKRLIELGIQSIKTERVQAMGFDPSTCTQISFEQYSVICRCYDIEYRRTNSKIYAIRFTP